MKLSVSLPDDDVMFLDDYVSQSRAESRSAALHRAVRLLRALDLQDEYRDAWIEWESEGHAADWETVVADGIETP